MTAFITLANSVFAAIIVCAFFFARNGVVNTFLFNILFYIIITPILTVTLMKVAYSGESEMIVRDALQRMYSILNVSPLSEAANPKQPVDSSIELKDAPIILMDEATASLDVDNESLIQEEISDLIKDKTVLVIAHRMRTVDGADKIVVLKDGVVAEQGAPAELHGVKGIYSHMINMQMENESWKMA